MKKINPKALIGYIVLITLIASSIYTIVSIILAPTTLPAGTTKFIRVKSDYILMLAQCILGIIAFLLPSMLEKRWNIKIPSNMLVLYIIFLYCAIYLGEVRNFYYNVPHWDTILHTFSGAMLGALAFSLISILNKSEMIPVTISPIFMALFTLCFAVTMGVIWEIYEFSFDYILNTNMQKFALENGTNLIGKEALLDTMKDLIVDTLGGLIISIIGYISLKNKKGWVEKMIVKVKQPSDK